jgi:hypothetical protein
LLRQNHFLAMRAGEQFETFAVAGEFVDLSQGDLAVLHYFARRA